MRVVDVTLNELNAVANEPDVLCAINPFVDRIDLAWIYNQPGVLVKGCVGVQGCAVLIPWPDSAIEAHWFFPGHGGVQAIRTIRDWIFERTSTALVFGNVPKANLAARLLNKALGARTIGELTDAHGRPAVTMACSREEWASHKKTRA